MQELVTQIHLLQCVPFVIFSYQILSFAFQLFFFPHLIFFLPCSEENDSSPRMKNKHILPGWCRSVGWRVALDTKRSRVQFLIMREATD